MHFNGNSIQIPTDCFPHLTNQNFLHAMFYVSHCMQSKDVTYFKGDRFIYCYGIKLKIRNSLVVFVLTTSNISFCLPKQLSTSKQNRTIDF